MEYNMAQGVITKTGREKLCTAHAGDISLPAITQMAFGSGGVDEAGAVIATTGEEVSLRAELLVKDIDGHTYRKRLRGATASAWERPSWRMRASARWG